MAGARTQEAVAAELEIRELVARYADAVNRRDAEAWDATWTKEGEWVVFGTPFQGEKRLETWRTLMGGLRFVVQLVHSGVIELQGDEAIARWYLTEQGMSVGDEPMLSLGVYHDRCRRTGEGWRFVSRRFDPLYIGQPDLSGQINPFPQVPDWGPLA